MHSDPGNSHHMNSGYGTGGWTQTQPNGGYGYQSGNLPYGYSTSPPWPSHVTHSWQSANMGVPDPMITLAKAIERLAAALEKQAAAGGDFTIP